MLQMLHACLAPSWSDSHDELEIRNHERWVDSFQRFMKLNTRLAVLPNELLDQIGSLCHDSKLELDMRPEYSKAMSELLLGLGIHRGMWDYKRRTPPVRRNMISIHFGATLRVRRLYIGSRPYVVSIEPCGQAEGERISKGCDTLVDSKCDTLDLDIEREGKWTALIAVVDVSGIRSLSLCLASTPSRLPKSKNTWLRVIPRIMLNSSPRMFYCNYQGLAVRDIVPTTHVDLAPLFDALPRSMADLVWFTDPRTKYSPCPTPRMMQRTVPPFINAITIAFQEGSSLDFHLHDGDISKTREFYASMASIKPAPILRYVDLQPDETLVDIGVRTCDDRLAPSTCIMFATSHNRLIDLGPFMSDRNSYTMTSILRQTRKINAIYINKRSSHRTKFIVAVDITESPAAGARTTAEHWAARKLEPEPEPPQSWSFTDRHISINRRSSWSFRDQMVVGQEVGVWEEVDETGVKICKGIRTATNVLGTWREGLEEQGVISRRNLVGERMANGSLDEDRAQRVAFLTREERLPRGARSFVPNAGDTIVWWTFEKGEMVQRIYA
ncbi:hypothetical protein PRZ48_004067 [Zasmidium cellare]|uniref:F-box domain-containing protein n=1 Tax=Zasmidium cellare TaxID=395010 RepID=A0ABR0EWU1_ZASCE|nr:hypothetical protein PRZ48_004067 [Zasmidium cellare]